MELACASSPCYSGVTCEETPDEAPGGYRCGACPPGLTGNGVHCEDVDECQYANPCDPRAGCINRSPVTDRGIGFQCGQCPEGYTEDGGGGPPYGTGIEEARSARRQSCRDVDECAERGNGGCVEHSTCINTPGSFRCGPCESGYVGNQTVGCRPDHHGQTVCPDGRTLCNENAFCVKRKGFVNYVCQCNVGWAGDGKICGRDSDLDGLCDYELSCADRRCRVVSGC